MSKHDTHQTQMMQRTLQRIQPEFTTGTKLDIQTSIMCKRILEKGGEIRSIKGKVEAMSELYKEQVAIIKQTIFDTLERLENMTVTQYLNSDIIVPNHLRELCFSDGCQNIISDNSEGCNLVECCLSPPPNIKFIFDKNDPKDAEFILRCEHSECIELYEMLLDKIKVKVMRMENPNSESVSKSLSWKQYRRIQKCLKYIAKLCKADVVEKALDANYKYKIGVFNINNQTAKVSYAPTNLTIFDLMKEADLEKGYKESDYNLDILHKITPEFIGRIAYDYGFTPVDRCVCTDVVTITPGNIMMRNTDFNLLDIVHTSLNHVRYFSFGSTKYCHRICQEQEKLYLPSYINAESNFIMRFSCLTGCLISNGRPGDGVKLPMALYPINHQQFLQASSNGLHIVVPVERAFSTTCKLLSGNFCDVAYHNNRVAALETERSHVHIINIETYPPVHESTFHLHDTLQGHESIIIQNEAVYIATSDHKIKKFSFSGDLLWQWGSHGNEGLGFLDRPKICMVDDNESLLIADQGNNRIQVVDNQCNWHLVPILEVDNPADAIFSDNVLYVLDGEGSNVHFYEYKGP